MAAPGSFQSWMAWRQVVSTKGRSLSFMTWMSILGVTIGVAALVIVLSVMGGFERDLKAKMFRGLPHVEILSKRVLAGFSLDRFSLDEARAQFPRAVGVEPFVQSDVVLKRGRHLASVALFGVDPELGGRLWGFSDGLPAESLTQLPDAGEGLPGIILGQGLAAHLNADQGDVISVLSPQAGVSGVMSGQKLSSRFQVVAIFRTDLPRFDSRYAVVDLGSGRKFLPDYDHTLDEQSYVSGIAVNLSDPEEIGLGDDRLTAWPELRVQTWQEVNKSLLFALKLEKFTMGAILLLIVLVAAFSISGTMMMTVFHKKNQISLMRSLGMDQKEVLGVFVRHGSLIGLLGILFGLTLGLIACWVIHTYPIIDLPQGIYHQRRLPVRFLPVEYAVICGCAFFLALAAAVYPSIIAARQDPGSGLRYT